MGLADLLRTGVAIADRVTGGPGGLQVSVTHRARTGQDADGKPTFGTAVTRTGILVYETKGYRDRQGHEQVSDAQLTFLGDVAVDDRDRLTLPNGTSPAIGTVRAPADAGEAGAVFVTEVLFGEATR